MKDTYFLVSIQLYFLLVALSITDMAVGQELARARARWTTECLYHVGFSYTHIGILASAPGLRVQ